MKRNVKKFLAVVMALVIAVSIVPVSELVSRGLTVFSSAVEDSENLKAAVLSENLTTSRQKVTIKSSGKNDIAGYFWGKNSNYTRNDYKTVTAPVLALKAGTEGDDLKSIATETVTAGGIYYLTVMDESGNVSNTAEIKFYETTLARGYNVSPSTIITPAEGDCSFTLPTPTRDGRTFKNWNTKLDGTGVAYADNSTYTPVGDMTLYGQWELDIEDIEIENYPKQKFHLGDKFSYDGLEIAKIMGNGKAEVISEGFEVSTPDMSVPGKKTVTVTYGNKTDSYEINVTDHSYGDSWVTDETSHWHECSICHLKKDVATHTAKDWTIEKDATYYEDGIKVKKCDICSSVFETEKIGKLILGVPSDIKVTYPAPGTADITFSAVKDALGYKIFYKNAGTAGKTVVTKTNSYKLTGLELGKAYEIFVRAYLGTGDKLIDGAWSSVCKITVPSISKLEIAASPKTKYHMGEAFSADGLSIKATYSDGYTETLTSGFSVDKPDMTKAGDKAVKVTYKGAELTFNINVEAHKCSSKWTTTTNYHWHECSICKGKCDLGKHTADKWTVTKAPTYFANGKRVKVCKTCGKTIASETMNKLVLSAPKSLKVVSLTASTAKITFSSVKGATGYQIFRDDVDEGFITNKNYYVFKGLKPGKKYLVLICAYTQSGKNVAYSGWSDMAEFKNVPVAVKGAGAKALSTSELKIFWTKLSGVAGYHVYNKTTGKSYLTTSDTYKITGLKAGTKYNVFVRAYYLSGKTRYYGAWTAVKNEITKPVQTAITSIKGGSKQFTVAYKGVSGATGYQVTYSTDSSFKNSKYVIVKGKSATVKNLKANTKYYVCVRAYIKADTTNSWAVYSAKKSVKTSNK